MMNMIGSILRNSGFSLSKLRTAIKGWQRYQTERSAFMAKPGAMDMRWGKELPILHEWQENSGELGEYFFQDLTVARWIHDVMPERHIDVGSRIDGFIGHLAVFREVEVIDIRRQTARIENVKFHQLDLTLPLPSCWLSCADSVSCLHSIEHFGLGRYGDAIDPDGHLKGLEQLKAMVKPGGALYLSTQIGNECIQFNAHRVFAPTTVIGWFREGWEIEKSASVAGQNCFQSIGHVAVSCFKEAMGVGIIVARKCLEPKACNDSDHPQR